MLINVCVLALAHAHLAALPYERRVRVTSGGPVPAVIVTEFLAHGALGREGTGLEVRDARQALVPWRVLQMGPGDHCRLAFQTSGGQRTYTVHYGEGAAAASPPWTAQVGLVLETRSWTKCDLRRADAVRRAWESAQAIGADFVAQVFHRHDPNAPGQGPFLSVYRGHVEVARPGPHRFFTTSQDASFLLIDGKTIASALGAHGPVGDSRHRGEVTLDRGLHTFEYVHAATGEDACMVAAWQPPGADKPEVIPPEAFGSHRVAHLPALGPWLDGKTPQRDVLFRVLGDAPTADDSALVRVQFQAFANGQAATGRVFWDFGDGQTSTRPSPTHIYLRPGEFTVRLAANEADPGVINRVRTTRSSSPRDKDNPGDAARDYLPVVDAYDVTRLDPGSALALVRLHRELEQPLKAAKVGQTWLRARREPPGDDEASVLALARLVGPLLRDTLDDPAAALACWVAAGGLARRPDVRAACALEAADIALHDLLDAKARSHLDTATAALARVPSAPELAVKLQRLWGDWHARAGERDEALAAYAQATRLLPKSGVAEAQARRGARGRSVEAFLREGAADRALAELRPWQDEDPAGAIEGHVTFLMARCQQARKHHDRTIALATDHAAISPDSAFADQLAFLAAESEEKLGRADRATARLRAFLVDHPGSPLATRVREKLAATPGKRPRER